MKKKVKGGAKEPAKKKSVARDGGQPMSERKS